ncbi:uncharacterized protein EKO05_0002068 [Ascochyta rabiei]|uniref:Phosphorelay sensor kinase n=1 Tax=Didymella rabiei TaxID=5454 RepID=A0A163C5T0_DIDRA|nr:uncharacterized protein EKO05_0002068 [Ascochyta rabiei]KZM22224.1 phosphorelay sensor kinase [Ascochyta rabiei]UPX11462.1 hypothetical protein EKO05_0002068 [Ascochyta rabiei]
MSELDDEAQSLLEFQLKPALVLDDSGVVIAINPGGLRFLCTATSTGQHTSSPVVGRKISDLNVVISPNASPALWTWDEILCVAVNTHTKFNRNNEPTKASAHSRDVFQATDDFWDLEAQQQPLVESSIYLIRTTPDTSTTSTSKNSEGSSKVKARANVCWYPSGIFLVVFDRPFMSPPLRRSPSPAAGCFHYLDDKSLAPAHYIPKTSLAPLVRDGSGPASHIPNGDQVKSLVPYITVTLDEVGQVVQFSDSWYLFTGLSKEESLGSGWISAIHPDDVRAMTSAWTDVLQNDRESWTYEARYWEASSGEYYWFLVRAQVYKDASGQVVCWYAYMLDMNDVFIARREEERRQHSMLTLISQTDVLLWGVDRSNRPYICEGGLNWNPPGIPNPLLSTARQETTQIDLGLKTSRKREQEKLVSGVQAVLLGREFASVIEHTEGDRYFRTIFVAERTAQGTATDEDCVTEAALALTFETTDQVVQSGLRLENERLALNEKAASDASALKSRFLANTSHEIRTPISGIIGLSELLRDSSISKQQADLIHDIRTSAQFLLALVNDILDLSKIDSGQLGIECIPCSPCETIRETLVPLQFQAKEKGLDLGWTYDVNTEDAFLGDPHRIRQVLTNLISNSIKFTHKGTIHLTISAVQSVDSEVSNIQFVVQDSGIGIAQGARDLLFKPFSQADSSTARIYGGTGLGLSICQELVELMGGRMALQSTLGKGTAVTFNIPFKLDSSPRLLDQTQSGKTSDLVTTVQSVEDEQTHEPPSNRAGLQTSDAKIFVLLVDDNAINRKVNSHFIVRSGYEVATACNGQEALDYVCKTSTQPQPDIIFMDCMMPVVDGYEATSRIRNDADMFDERTRKLPIVALTASGQQSNRERCWDDGMDDYICRPVSQRTLKDAVLKWTSPKDT